MFQRLMQNERYHMSDKILNLLLHSRKPSAYIILIPSPTSFYKLSLKQLDDGVTHYLILLF
jgi:hypothetical protein